MTPATLQLLPLAKIHESPLNPRQHFDPVALANLVASLQAHGQLTPILVRPNSSGFEIAAGHRRYRAAKLAGLPALEAKVRELTDAEFAEILTIENDEREDVHPLEQAGGYRLLMEKAGYDVAKIAARVQRSHDFVYDRLRLLQLTPELKRLFLEDRFGLAQAVVLAKLSPDEQARAATRPTHANGRSSGLWRSAEPTLDEKAFPLVANTAAELEYWIAHELRFKEDAVELEELFPATAVAIEAAAETGTRVVSISYEDYLRPNAKDQNERTFTRNFWKRADELEGSKSCEYAVVGIVRAGESRGEAIGVCLRRDKCKVHWAASVKIAEARAKEKSKGASPAKSGKATPKEPSWKAAVRRQQAKYAAERRVRERWERAIPTMVDAFLERIEAAPAAGGILGALLTDGVWISPNFKGKALPIGTTAEALVRHLASVELLRIANSTYDAERKLPKLGKTFGVDVKKILETFPLEKAPAADKNTDVDDEGDDEE